MKRNVGDKVKIKTDLVVNEFYNTYIDFCEDMVKYKGEESIIASVEDGCYKLNIDKAEWNWADDMLEDVTCKWTFNVQEFKNNDIAINCESEEESIELFKILTNNGITQWQNESNLNINDISFTRYKNQTCYEIGTDNKLSYSNTLLYQKLKYQIYKFSEIDFSKAWNKESIDEVSLHTNEPKKFDITKEKYITLDDLLSNRGFKTGDIIGDMDNIGIVYGNKVIYITAKCTESINPKAYCEIIPIELIESNNIIQKALSDYLNDVDYDLLERYFIKIEEPPKLKTICSVKFTVNADCPKDFILENDSEVLAVNDIVEANTGGKNYQYAKVVEVNTLELSEHEINNYRTCRKLSL